MKSFTGTTPIITYKVGANTVREISVQPGQNTHEVTFVDKIYRTVLSSCGSNGGPQDTFYNTDVNYGKSSSGTHMRIRYNQWNYIQLTIEARYAYYDSRILDVPCRTDSSCTCAACDIGPCDECKCDAASFQCSTVTPVTSSCDYNTYRPCKTCRFIEYTNHYRFDHECHHSSIDYPHATGMEYTGSNAPLGAYDYYNPYSGYPDTYQYAGCWNWRMCCKSKDMRIEEAFMATDANTPDPDLERYCASQESFVQVKHAEYLAADTTYKDPGRAVFFVSRVHFAYDISPDLNFLFNSQYISNTDSHKFLYEFTHTIYTGNYLFINFDEAQASTYNFYGLQRSCDQVFALSDQVSLMGNPKDIMGVTPIITGRRCEVNFLTVNQQPRSSYISANSFGGVSNDIMNIWFADDYSENYIFLSQYGQYLCENQFYSTVLSGLAEGFVMNKPSNFPYTRYWTLYYFYVNKTGTIDIDNCYNLGDTTSSCDYLDEIPDPYYQTGHDYVSVSLGMSTTVCGTDCVDTDGTRMNVRLPVDKDDTIYYRSGTFDDNSGSQSTSYLYKSDICSYVYGPFYERPVYSQLKIESEPLIIPMKSRVNNTDYFTLEAWINIPTKRIPHEFLDDGTSNKNILNPAYTVASEASSKALPYPDDPSTETIITLMGLGSYQLFYEVFIYTYDDSAGTNSRIRLKPGYKYLSSVSTIKNFLSEGHQEIKLAPPVSTDSDFDSMDYTHSQRIPSFWVNIALTLRHYNGPNYCINFPNELVIYVNGRIINYNIQNCPIYTNQIQPGNSALFVEQIKGITPLLNYTLFGGRIQQDTTITRLGYRIDKSYIHMTVKEIRLWRKGNYDYNNFVYQNLYNKLYKTRTMNELAIYIGFQYPTEVEEMQDESSRSGTRYFTNREYFPSQDTGSDSTSQLLRGASIFNLGSLHRYNFIEPYCRNEIPVLITTNSATFPYSTPTRVDNIIYDKNLKCLLTAYTSPSYKGHLETNLDGFYYQGYSELSLNKEIDARYHHHCLPNYKLHSIQQYRFTPSTPSTTLRTTQLQGFGQYYNMPCKQSQGINK